MGDLIEWGGKGLPSLQGGAALIDATMSQYAVAVQNAHDYRAQWEGGGGTIGLADLGAGEIVTAVRFLDRARSIHATWLRHYPAIRATRDALLGVVLPPCERVDEATAARMLGVLFNRPGKRQNDEECEALLTATVSMFSAVDESFALSTGLWKPLNAHPLILALAIKQLNHLAVFTSPAELRKAMKQAHDTIAHRASATAYIEGMIERADEIMFVGDRVAWAANYARVGRDVVQIMRDQLNEAPDDEDDEPPSPRWLALDALAAVKRAEAPKSVAAACSAKAMKRTHKPKGGTP